MDIYFFAFVNGAEPKLLYYFLKYYIDLGIIPTNMFIVIHISSVTNETDESINYLKKYNIKYIISENWSSSIKTDFVNKYIKSLPLNSYLIYPDLDEFFYYNGMNINEYINFMEKKKYIIAQGMFCNRIGANYEICDIDISKETIFEQFPVSFYDKKHKITKNLTYCQTKICALKLIKNIQYTSAHNVNTQARCLDEKNSNLIVYHFKYTKYTINSIKSKIKIYKNRKGKHKIFSNQLSLFTKKNNKWYLCLKGENAQTKRQTPHAAPNAPNAAHRDRLRCERFAFHNIIYG